MRHLLASYNSNPNTNGRRSLRVIRGKWNTLARTYRQRRDQENRTGQAPQAPWVYHEKMAEIGAQMATVYSSFMHLGSTVDNRAEEQDRSTSRSGGRNRIDPSVQQFTQAIQELSDSNYARAAPEREAQAAYLR